MSCDIVKDLYGIYKDGCASEKSKAIIKHHLKHCEECRRFYRDIPSQSRTESCTSKGDYTLLAKRIKRRRTFMTAAIISGFVVLSAWAIAETLDKK